MIERVGKSAVIELDRHLTIRVSENGAAFDTIEPALAIDQERIARFCLSANTGLTQDLIMLCGVIWWADRRVTRRRATAWARASISALISARSRPIFCSRVGALAGFIGVILLDG